jgi:hypothetical protein
LSPRIPIPWPRLVAEVTAIVFSILLAFGIQAWWEGRGAAELRESALRTVLSDMEANSRQLERWVVVNEGIVSNSDFLLDLLASVPPGERVTVPDTLLVRTILIPTFDPRRAAVEVVTTTGSVTLVRDDSLRAELNAWLRLVADMAEDEAAVGSIETLQLVPALGRQVNLRGIYNDMFALSNGEHPPRLIGSSSDIVADLELMALVSHRRHRVNMVRGNMVGLLEQQRRIMEQIHETLGP